MQGQILPGHYLVFNFIMPFVLIWVGALLKKHPVSDMRKGNGYNTPTSRKSQEHWDYAQKIAPDIYIAFGKWLLLVKAVFSVAVLVIQCSVRFALGIGFGLDVIVLVSSFFYTDSQIRKEFA